MNKEKEMQDQSKTHRRVFVKQTIAATLTGISGLSLLSGCSQNEEEEKEVSPPEDLMQEHGLLNRILLIYDTCKMHLVNKENFSKQVLLNSAQIVRTFVEDYHERQEENYIFPRFQKAHQQIDLVQTLLEQHNAGRRITDQIMQLCKSQTATEAENQKLLQLLTDFNTMYRPHESREDTVLFPAFRRIVSKHEYDSLGEEFENNEKKLFGEDGFETTVNKVAELEKSLGIYDLSQFTPKE